MLTHLHGVPELGQAHPLARHIGNFLPDLANSGASGHTLRAYEKILTDKHWRQGFGLSANVAVVRVPGAAHGGHMNHSGARCHQNQRANHGRRSAGGRQCASIAEPAMWPGAS